MWLAEKNQEKKAAKTHTHKMPVFPCYPVSVPEAYRGQELGWGDEGPNLLGRGDLCPADTGSSVLKTTATEATERK